MSGLGFLSNLYGSDDENEEKEKGIEKLEQKKEQPKVEKKQITLTVPLDMKSAKKIKEYDDEEEKPVQPKKAATEGPRRLGFLPAPKFSGDQKAEEKPKVIEEKPKVEKPVATQSSNTKKRALSFHTMKMTKEQQEKESETTEEVPSQEQQTEETPAQTNYVYQYPEDPQQQYQEDYSQYYNQDPNYYNYAPQPEVQASQPQYSSYAMYKTQEPKPRSKPMYSSQISANSVPREFWGFEDNLVEVNANQILGDKPAVNDPVLELLTKAAPSSSIVVGKDAKKQNSASYLLWDMEQKQAMLEIQRINSKKNKVETRMKYGW